jgi:hypothetical protein
LLFAWLFDSGFADEGFPAAGFATLVAGAASPFFTPFSDFAGADLPAFGDGFAAVECDFGFFEAAFAAGRRSLTDGRSRAAAEDRLPPLAEATADEDRRFAFALFAFALFAFAIVR